jgi:hypothetical protein
MTVPRIFRVLRHALHRVAEVQRCRTLVHRVVSLSVPMASSPKIGLTEFRRRLAAYTVWLIVSSKDKE